MNLRNKVIENFFLPIGDKLLNSSFMNELKRWRKLQYLPREEVLEYQKKKLSILLQHAKTNTSFYKNVNLSDDPYADLAALPVVGKKEYRSVQDFLTGLPEEFIPHYSSGSSGMQGVTYLSKADQSINRALQILWWEWGGYQMGEPIIQTGAAVHRDKVKAFKDRLLNTYYVPAFNLNDDQVLQILVEARARGVKHLLGYASSLHVLATVAIKHGLTDLRLDSAISWGDKLFDHYRTAIADAFGCYTYNTYACGEGIMIGAQCPTKEFVIMEPHCLVEVVDENNHPVPDGSIGRVVVSRLDALAMPMIRYNVGDLMIKKPYTGATQSGHHFAQIDKLIGRDTDIIQTPGGNFMIPHTFTIVFEFIPEVKQFCVIQDNPESINIEIVKGEGYAQQIEETIKNQLYEKIGESFPISFIYVDYIPPTPSGKPQIVQNRIKNTVKYSL